MNRTTNIILIILISCVLFNQGFAQISAENKKNYKAAVKNFDNEEYKKALPVFLNIEKSGENFVELKYQIGICYINTRFERKKAIPYLEAAIKSKEFEVPADVYLELGKLNHELYDFDKALLNYNKFLFYAHKSNLYINFAKRMVKACNNAVLLLTDSLNVKIDNLGKPVNTFYSEYSPFISADGSTLYFNKITYTNKNYLNEGIKEDSLLSIMMSYFTDNVWSNPEQINVITDFNNPVISLEGITPDGQHLFINITHGSSSDLYSCIINGYTCEQLKKLDHINSEYWEGRISQTPDGSEIYFSSNRPGGYGGKDIYKLVKDVEGNWAKNPINLGPAINTFYNENSPFIHPDKKTLFFSSEGHMAIGGFDIFKSVYENNMWSYAENIGYPINTTMDELYFVLSANGKSGYFSSSVNNKYENHDIYQVTLKNSIPLTLVKGTILAGDPPKPTSANIKVIDKETNLRVKYIYNPNPNTGQYLMIFPPAKNYDMIVEAPGYLPQLINIYIPDQTHFYELFQEIVLKQINNFGKNLGEKIVVNNTFYDIYKTYAADSITSGKNAVNESVNNEKTNEKDYNRLLQLIEDIINTTDSVGIEFLDEEIDLISSTEKHKQQLKNFEKLFSLVEEAINTTDSISLVILDRNTLYDEKSTQTYFYAENSKDNNLVATIIDNDTIYTTPPLLTKGEDFNKLWPNVVQYKIKNDTTIKHDEKPVYNIKSSTEKDRKIIYTGYVFFDSKKSIIKNKYNRELNQIAELILNNKKIGVLLLGFTDSKGEDDPNLKLSNERVTTVLKYLIDQGISAKSAILKGVGESKSKNEKTELDRKFNRRVEILMFELIK